MSLSRRALLLAGAIVALAIAGIWGGEPLADAWRWPAALLLLAMAWERYRLPRDFTINRTIEPVIRLGTPVSYLLTIVNRERRRLVLDFQADYPSVLAGETLIRHCRLDGDSRREELSVTPVRLGETTLGPLYIRLLGRLGLVWWNRRIDDEIGIKVEPDSLNRSAALPGQSAGGQHRAQGRPGTGYELLMLRDYRQGDPMHAIDWKATARRRRPMQRVFNREQRLETAILLDCGRGSDVRYSLLDRLHHFVNVASRLSEYAVLNGDQVACLAYAEDIFARSPMAGGTAALRHIRALLTGLSSVAQESNPLTAALELARNLHHRSLIVFLTETEHADASGQLLRAVHLLARKHHVLVASIEDDGIRDILQQPADHWLSPYRNFAAREYLRGRELTRRKLLRSGVSVVSAPPPEIDHALLQRYRRLRERSSV